ncbi:hypothetical protein [Polynucleobacter sp. MG-27-Goln-C1]|uniref:hypothetical protein n=1 Tax=Polynucleobacter sp. MG-27-Goln-C1 TaxID=1819726 RepID=UPI001C0BD0D4|nr:hypothetical protein [Polynucleobacter sp. MG-27-Goln-C1]
MHSVATIKPLNPSQARIEALKAQKERAKTALDAERKRQKVSKAQEKLKKAVSA